MIEILEQNLANSTTPLAKIEAMNQLAYELQYHNLTRAFDLANAAEQLALENRVTESVAYAGTLCNLGQFNLRKGEIETAVDQLFRGLQIYRQHNNAAGHARASGLIGLTFGQIGNYPESLNYHLKQLQLSQEHKLSQEEALAYNGLGIVHNNTENHEDALTNYLHSIRISEVNTDLRQKAITLSNCAYTAKYLGEYEEAFAYGQESIELSQQVGNIISESHARLEIAKTHLLRQEFTEALGQLQINLEHLNETEYTYPLADTLLTAGKLYNQWQKPEFALPYLQRALTLSNDIQYLRVFYRCHEELARTYQLKQHFEKALHHYQEFHAIKEKTLNEQSIFNMRAIEIAYQLHAAEKEKELLKDKNKELETVIAERIQIEEELKTHQDRLEETVARRTKKLQKQNEELERFTYTVSHDLKSPLITIRGFLGLLERDIAANNQEKINRNLSRIDSAAERMLNLLENLLELSKIGHTPDTLAHIPLQAIILEAKDLVAGQIEENNVTIILEDNLPEVYGDYPRLVELFQNLIDNSCKFMGPQTNPQITIGAKMEDNTLLCFVQDNGIGVEKQYQNKIFNLFERLDQSTNGTGIGLALVKRIVEYHNGRIWIESAGENKGSTFFFTLKTPKISKE